MAKTLLNMQLELKTFWFSKKLTVWSSSSVAEMLTRVQFTRAWMLGLRVKLAGLTRAQSPVYAWNTPAAIGAQALWRKRGKKRGRVEDKVREIEQNENPIQVKKNREKKGKNKKN